MAKGQKRSTKEIRKPKQEKKVAEKVESTFGGQMKAAAGKGPAGDKSKR